MHAITYRGSYCYRDRAALELAIERVRDELVDDDQEPTEWLSKLVPSDARGGARLDIELSIAGGSERRFVAANVLLVLARGATSGSVEARQADRTLDVYAPDPDDEA